MGTRWPRRGEIASFKWIKYFDDSGRSLHSGLKRPPDATSLNDRYLDYVKRTKEPLEFTRWLPLRDHL